VLISIENYGIGFSEQDKKRILELGVRANVDDPVKDRPGTGLGLPHALKVIEAAGGILDLQSGPADSNPRADRRRYLTIVRVSLPISTKRQRNKGLF